MELTSAKAQKKKFRYKIVRPWQMKHEKLQCYGRTIWFKVGGLGVVPRSSPVPDITMQKRSVFPFSKLLRRRFFWAERKLFNWSMSLEWNSERKGKLQGTGAASSTTASSSGCKFSGKGPSQSTSSMDWQLLFTLFPLKLGLSTLRKLPWLLVGLSTLRKLPQQSSKISPSEHRSGSPRDILADAFGSGGVATTPSSPDTMVGSLPPMDTRSLRGGTSNSWAARVGRRGWLGVKGVTSEAVEPAATQHQEYHWSNLGPQILLQFTHHQRPVARW